MSVTALVRDLVLSFTYYEPAELKDDTPLDLDSLDIAELMQGLEDRFGIDVEHSLRLADIGSIRTISAFVQRISEAS